MAYVADPSPPSQLMVVRGRNTEYPRPRELVPHFHALNAIEDPHFAEILDGISCT